MKKMTKKELIYNTVLENYPISRLEISNMFNFKPKSVSDILRVLAFEDKVQPIIDENSVLNNLDNIKFVPTTCTVDPITRIMNKFLYGIK